ncbi:MAG: hypothetical protein KF678_01055 [Phycisphaeraceae bacterium]|nr:hypothetical protein [Phycisphaeraceae bacterium]
MRHAHTIGSLVAVAGLALSAAAQPVFISEVHINPVINPDNGREAIEIMGPPGLVLNGYKFIIIEGDFGNRDPFTGEFPPAGQRPGGTVDAIIHLDGMAIGSNGILLIRDSNIVIPPPPSAGTNVVIFDFNPDIENGGNTFVLGKGTLGPAIFVGNDLDLNDDGILDDLSQWANFIERDAVSYVNGDEGGQEYAADLGGTELGNLGGWTPDALYRIIYSNNTPAGWACGDLIEADPTQPGRSFWDPLENYGFGLAGITIPSPTNIVYGTDLGIRNITIPAPATCYANCDGSTGSPQLTANDFQCFLNKYAAGDTYANCDGSTGNPALTANDFQCFLNKYAAGCT